MSRRDQIRMSDAEVREFIAARKTVILTSQGPRGFPHPMPMWFVPGPDGTIRMTTYARSQKVRNLRRDPRVSLLVESGLEYGELKGVVIYGRAELSDDVEEVIDVLLEAGARPAGRPPPAVREGMRGNASKRVVIRVKPERVVSWDHAKLGGAY